MLKCPSAAKAGVQAGVLSKTLRRSQDDHTHLKTNTNICTGLCELNHCWMPDLPRVLPRDGAAVCQGAALLPAALGEVQLLLLCSQISRTLCNGRQHPDELLTLLRVLLQVAVVLLQLQTGKCRLLVPVRKCRVLWDRLCKKKYVCKGISLSCVPCHDAC